MLQKKFMTGDKYGPKEPVASGESLYNKILTGEYQKAGSMQSASSGGKMYYDPIANMWKTPTSLKTRIQSNVTSQTTVGSASELLPKFTVKKFDATTPRT